MVPEQRLRLKGIFSKIDYLGCPRDIFRRADVGGESLAHWRAVAFVCLTPPSTGQAEQLAYRARGHHSWAANGSE